MVAHNGNSFDYKILNAECNDIEDGLPGDILCVDSLPAFRHLEKYYQKQPEVEEEMVTDDEEEDERHDIFQLSKRAKPANFKLQSVYESFYGAECTGGHRAEKDCQMLLDCLIAYQANSADFVEWADQNCKLLSDIGSLERPWYRKRDMY